MTEDLLLEIGTEELPASFVSGAVAALPTLARKALAEARLAHGEVRAFGTPRRLALVIDGVAAAQPDVAEDVLGPPRSVALGPDGKPSKAGEGFAKKQGIDPASLFVVSTEKGDYVAYRREASGLPAREVLPRSLAGLVADIPFAKSMRWGGGDVAFGRPIQWMVGLLGADVLPVRFAGLVAARASRGHRFLAPGLFDVGCPGGYVARLREAHVVVDPEERRTSLAAALEDAARAASGELVHDDFLLGECANLVEEPFVLLGSFDEAFLALPERLIVSVMRDHQRYFALRGRDGKLLPRYLNVVNTALDPLTITRGNDRVLRARLADARFFVEEDRKQPLASRADKLGGVVFQAKLGTVKEKAERLAKLIANVPGDDVALHGARAALLAKADLVTHVVGEFPELQGEAGEHYARLDGEPEPVAVAIREHYLPRGASDGLPESPLGAAVALADRVDTLVGCFGIGLVPSGSADPFALRRAALGVLRILRDGPVPPRSLRALFELAHSAYLEQRKPLAPAAEVLPKLDEFVRARIRASYGETIAGDVVEACLAAWSGDDVRDLEARLRSIASFRRRDDYASLAVAFKRAYNIAKDAPRGDPEPSAFVEGAERDLWGRVAAVRAEVAADVERGRYEHALERVAAELRDPIDRFFESVFVMAEDAQVRDNRLRLLGAVARMLTDIAHFHLLAT